MCVCIYMIHINTAHKYRQPLDDALARELCVETRDGVSHGGVHGGVGHGLEGLDGMPWQHLSIAGRKHAQSYSLQTRVSSRFESEFVERKCIGVFTQVSAGLFSCQCLRATTQLQSGLILIIKMDGKDWESV